MDTIKQVNGIVWVFAAILISFVLVQATVFMKKALDFNKKHEVLTSEEVKLSMRTGIFSIIGPAFSVMIAAISLMALMGPAATFMRIGVIGSANYEIMLAGIAAETIGVELGSAEMTAAIFVLALFAMILGSAPYFINCFITLKPMEKALEKGKDQVNSFTKIVGLIASVALMTYFAVDNARKGIVELLVIIVSGAVCLAVSMIADKTGKKWLYEWLLAIGLIAGLASSIFFTQVLGLGA
ncbi:MAG: DUF5058 family protein [Tissierellia bacterium]|nr:DUF5058 family protein [Tissierellia bacterium]